MPSRRVLRIVVVECHPSVRHALRANLEADPGFAVVGEAAGTEQALEAIERLRPDVVLLDLNLIERDGCSVIGALRERSPASRVLVLSTLEDERSIRTALAAGGHAHLPKDAFQEELIAAVRSVAGDADGSSARDDCAPSTTAPGLSAREVEVLCLVARGLSNGEIATALTLTEGTVKSHLRRIFVKMGVDDRTRAAIIALKQGAIRL